MRNLAFLKTAFDPSYEILGFRDVNATDTLARWTMGFDVLPIQRSPLGRWWWPRLEFTGTTLYGTSAETGLIERHLDTWDSIERQEYFSVEGFRHMLGQIFTLRAPPQFRGPPFTLLKCAPCGRCPARDMRMRSLLDDSVASPEPTHRQCLQTVQALRPVHPSSNAVEASNCFPCCRRKARYCLREYEALQYVRVGEAHTDSEPARRALASSLFPGTQIDSERQGVCTSSVGYVLPEESCAAGASDTAGDALSLHKVRCLASPGTPEASGAAARCCMRPSLSSGIVSARSCDLAASFCRAVISSACSLRGLVLSCYVCAATALTMHVSVRRARASLRV